MIRVSSSAATVADLAALLLITAGAVTGVLTGVFWTWLLAGFVAGMLVALVGRLVADANDARRATAPDRK